MDIKTQDFIDFEQKGMIVDISDWEGLKDFQIFYIEMNSYESTLLFLLNKNYDINNEIYQYYEKKYLDAYFNYYFKSEEFIQWLQLKINKCDKFQWMVNFKKEEVYIK